MVVWLSESILEMEKQWVFFQNKQAKLCKEWALASFPPGGLPLMQILLNSLLPFSQGGKRKITANLSWGPGSHSKMLSICLSKSPYKIAKFKMHSHYTKVVHFITIELSHSCCISVFLKTPLSGSENSVQNFCCWQFITIIDLQMVKKLLDCRVICHNCSNCYI